MSSLASGMRSGAPAGTIEPSSCGSTFCLSRSIPCTIEPAPLLIIATRVEPLVSACQVITRKKS